MGFSISLSDDHIIQQPVLRAPAPETHKFHRGHALVFSGPQFRTGGSRLAAQAALGVGAGLVTLVGTEKALMEHAAQVTAIMLQLRDGEFDAIDSRVTAFAIGPAYGTGGRCRRDVLALAGQGRAMVIDADGLTAFKDQREELFGSLHDQTVLTPHEGEFARLFPDIELDDRVDAAKRAANLAGCIVLLKGPKTVVAAPDGRFAINEHALSWLATAGSGDVLTGLICGVMAQGMGAFRAACIAAWLHGDIAIRHGPGLTADRMIDAIAAVLAVCEQK